MPVQSAIPTVKAALISTIGAALPDTQVTWATPRGDPAREWVRVGNVSGEQQAAALGRLRREENFRVEVLVSIVQSDIQDAQEVAERAFELVADGIESPLRADEKLGLGASGPLVWARVEKTDLAEGLAEGERWAEITVHVACKTRI